MKVRAALANGAWLAVSTPAWLCFHRALAAPERAQQAVLTRLLRDNEPCAFGREHGFGEVRSYEEFRRRVPIVEYADLEPWIARIMRGETSVLTQEPVLRLVPTSGSTGGRKLIPFTASLQREFNAATGPWMIDLCREHPACPLGPAYWSISPALRVLREEISAVPIGFDDDSAYLGGVRRKLVAATFAVSPAMRLVENVELFRYLTLLCLLREPELRLISVWHPSFLTLLLDALPAVWEELLADISRGGCERLEKCPRELRSAFQFPAQPKRAREIGHVDFADVRDLWPQLKLVSCWGDAQSAFAFADLHRRLPSVPLQSKGLLATEAFVTFPFRGCHPLAVTSHFFEFLDENDELYLAHELRRGQRYTVVVSTGGGLWRYRLGDWVEVEGFLGATPSLRFLGRGDRVSDLRGEKLSEVFVTRAISAACATVDFTTGFAMLAPELDPENQPCYTLFTEGSAPFALAAQLDRALRANPHYALCRDLGQLRHAELCSAGSDAFEIYRRIAAPTQRIGDIKAASISSRTDWRQHFSRSENNAPSL